MLSKGGVRRGSPVAFEIAVTPVAKPRMTQRDKWQKRPGVLKYRALCDEVRMKVKNVTPVLRYQACEVSVSFHLPMPSSWSKKKKEKMDGTPHLNRPDLDNIIKAWCDALYPEDSVIWSIHATKFWAYKGSISYEA